MVPRMIEKRLNIHFAVAMFIPLCSLGILPLSLFVFILVNVINCAVFGLHVIIGLILSCGEIDHEV